MNEINTQPDTEHLLSTNETTEQDDAECSITGSDSSSSTAEIYDELSGELQPYLEIGKQLNVSHTPCLYHSSIDMFISGQIIPILTLRVTTKDHSHGNYLP
jgi:hypothetical protein